MCIYIYIYITYHHIHIYTYTYIHTHATRIRYTHPGHLAWALPNHCRAPSQVSGAT